MNHPHEDQLLLLAYSEISEGDAGALEAHLRTCADCRSRLERLERARAALDWTTRSAARRRRGSRWTLVGLAVAAAIAIAVLRAQVESPTPQLAVVAPRYLAPDLAAIDSLLTHLEQERPYAMP